MSGDINTHQLISENLYTALNEWVLEYCCFSPDAYDNGKLKLTSIMVALEYLIDNKVFDSVKEIKREFGKQYKMILPDFLFNKYGGT